MAVATPPQVTEAFCQTGTKNVIPIPSQIGTTPGAASFTDGFVPLNATPIASGGIPPTEADMNGILNMLSAHIAYLQSGAGYVYNSAIATAISGYNLGAVLLAADGSGYWQNITANNTVNPDTTGTGWVPISQYGIGNVSGLAGTNYTLTPAQYGKSVLILTGALTANIVLVFPTIVGQWIIVNETTGAFTITCKTPSGAAAGVVVPQGGWPTSQTINCDNFNMYSSGGSYVTNASLAASLASYVTSASLAATLSGYVTNASLASQLANYITSGQLATALTPYLTASQVAATYVSQTSLALQLANYLSSSTAAATYVSQSLLSTTLSAYATVAAMQAYANGTQTLNQNGYQVFPGGLILEWGINPFSSSGSAVNFPKAFPHNCLQVTISPYGSSATCFVESFTSSGFVGVNGNGTSASWVATGF